MHFALPNKKNMNSQHDGMYKPRTAARPLWMRRSRSKYLLLMVLGGVALVFMLLKLIFGGGPPAGTPPVVIVTLMNPKAHTKQYLDSIKENREEYARKHGYGTFSPSQDDYDVGDSPKSWAKLLAMRHALKLYPHTEYFWFLNQDALIMNPTITIEEDIMKPSKLDKTMLRGQPIIPPESVITTFKHLKGEQIHFVLTQDKDGLGAGSFMVRQGDWAKFLLNTWFDPLYRSYNFQRAETHALEHIVQWHPTILSRLAIIPQDIINSYSRAGTAKAGSNTVYKDGDFVINFEGCDEPGAPKCEDDAKQYLTQWRAIFNAKRR